MADQMINQFSLEKTTVPDNSYFGFDWYNGTAWNTVKIASQNLKTALGIKNYAENDLILNDDRVHDHRAYNTQWTGMKTFRAEAGYAPDSGYSSFNFTGHGSTRMNKTFSTGTSAGVAMQQYGDKFTEFNNDVDVNGRFVVGYSSSGLPILNWGNTFAAPSGSNNALAVGTNGLASNLFKVNTDGSWDAGYLSGPVFSMGYNGSNHYLQDSNNSGLLIGQNSTMHASSILELRSTTRGFLPPRMTAIQAESISAAEGLVVYATNGTGVTITSKGWWG